MAIKRVVSTSFWNDDKVVEMFSPEDRYFMLYLMTNPHTTQLGIYELSKRTAGFELGYSTEAVEVLLDRFETKYGIIKRSKETSEIAVLNYLAYSVVKGGQPVIDCLNRELKQVKDKSLVVAMIQKLESRDDLLPTVSSFIEQIKRTEFTLPVCSEKRTGKGCCNNCRHFKEELDFQSGVITRVCGITNDSILAGTEYQKTCDNFE